VIHESSINETKDRIEIIVATNLNTMIEEWEKRKGHRLSPIMLSFDTKIGQSPLGNILKGDILHYANIAELKTLAKFFGKKIEDFFKDLEVQELKRFYERRSTMDFAWEPPKQQKKKKKK